jgi:hypothetical protein
VVCSRRRMDWMMQKAVRRSPWHESIELHLEIALLVCRRLRLCLQRNFQGWAEESSHSVLPVLHSMVSFHLNLQLRLHFQIRNHATSDSNVYAVTAHRME